MDLSIIVNHYKSPEVLKLCLGYIIAWQKTFEGESEIIVTDSETLSETKEIMAGYFPEIKYLTDKKNVGFGRSVNKALVLAKGNYIFLMNADVTISKPQELTNLLKFMQENPDVGIAGPKLLNFDETHQPSAFRFYTPFTILLRRTFLGKLPWGKKKLDEFILKDMEDLLKKPHPVDWLMGSAWMINKKHLDVVGLFDERFFMYMEDVDLCRRFWRDGFKVMYVPDITMYHFHGAASRSKNIFRALGNKYTRMHLRSAWKYFRKYGLKTPRYGV